MLDQAFERARREPSDINEHLDTLVALVSERNAETIIELGVRSGVSTTAWLHALDQRGSGRLISVDLDGPPPHLTAHPKWIFLQGDDLEENVLGRLPAWADIIFIDTSHTYVHTCREIVEYSKRTDCLVFHDSNVEHFPHLADQPPFPVRLAISDILEGRWDLEHHLHNNGLTIARRP